MTLADYIKLATDVVVWVGLGDTLDDSMPGTEAPERWLSLRGKVGDDGHWRALSLEDLKWVEAGPAGDIIADSEAEPAA